jgi:predicted RNase H-like HicB family nuclease
MKVCAVFEPNNEGGYGIYFPALPGCVSIGDTLGEARKMAQEAVTDHIALLLADGEALSPNLASPPRRTPKDAVVEVLDIPDAEVRAVVPLMRRQLTKAREKKRARCIRLNITLPEDLVARADRYADKHHETRSGLIAKGLETIIDRR